MTTLATTPAHPLVEKYQTVLDEACEALATRSYYSRYPESPSPKVYGENAAADGLAAYQQHLDAPYAALASQPSDGTEVGSEVSPYGPVLGVRYPRLDLDAALAAEVEIQSICMQDANFREAYEAFRERRKPEFR